MIMMSGKREQERKSKMAKVVVIILEYRVRTIVEHDNKRTVGPTVDRWVIRIEGLRFQECIYVVQVRVRVPARHGGPRGDRENLGWRRRERELRGGDRKECLDGWYGGIKDGDSEDEVLRWY